MIGSLVRWGAIIASAFVTLSFLFFAVNQTSTASRNQARAINGDFGVKQESTTKLPNPPPGIEKLREKENDGFHEFVDDVDDILTSPFTGISSSNSIWVRRLIPLVLCLIIYGLGGLYLARVVGVKRW